MEGVDTREDQIEALRVLSAGNTLIIVLLGGVLALQVRELKGMCYFLENGSQITPSLFFLVSFFFFFSGACHGHQRGDRSGRGDWK